MSPRQQESVMVPEADFRSYYGRAVIKPPVWKVPDVPAYLYLGGLAGASATMALCADLTGNHPLARTGRLVSAAGSLASVGALIHDLGRPKRFLNMLRVLKVTSPLSIGSWILAPFSALAVGAVGSQVTGWLPSLGRLSGAAAGVLGPAMTTYTAVLLSDTAVPAWHEGYRELPYLFAGSAVASAGASGLLSVPSMASAPARRMALCGTAVELTAMHRMRRRLGMVAEVYEQGPQRKALRLAETLSYAGVAMALLAHRSRAAAVAAGVALTTASAATRYGIFEGGRASARDPRYTVVPQRIQGPGKESKRSLMEAVRAQLRW